MKTFIEDLGTVTTWQDAVETGADSASPASGVDDQSLWQRAIDRLIGWAVPEDAIADDDVVPPTRLACDSASRLLTWLRDEGFPPPQAAVPDGDGGISFERRNGPHSASFEIAADGSIELIEFLDSRLVSRMPIEIKSRRTSSRK